MPGRADEHGRDRDRDDHAVERDRPAAQGIAAGQWDKIVAAMRAGVAYANVHTTNFPQGEIRGQINDTDQRQPE